MIMFKKMGNEIAANKNARALCVGIAFLAVLTVILYIFDQPAPTAVVVIDSTPQGADIYVNNALCGKTPRKITDMKTGLYTIELKHKGFEPWSERVQVNAGSDIVLSPKLKDLLFSIRIESVPPGAKIYVNKVYKGVTPETIYNVSQPINSIRLEREGYETCYRNVSLSVDNPKVHILAELKKEE